MKGREKMIAVLEIIRCAAAVALLVVLTMYVAYRWYVSVKETAYEEAEAIKTFTQLQSILERRFNWI